MEELSGEYEDEYYKYMDDEVWSMIRSDKWEAVPRKSASDFWVILATWYFK